MSMDRSRDWYEGAVFVLRQITGNHGQQHVGGIYGRSALLRLLRDYEDQLAAMPTPKQDAAIEAETADAMDRTCGPTAFHESRKGKEPATEPDSKAEALDAAELALVDITHNSELSLYVSRLRDGNPIRFVWRDARAALNKIRAAKGKR